MHSKAALAQALVPPGARRATAMRGGGDGLPLLRGITAQTIAGVAGEEQVLVFAERVRCLRQLAATLRERHGVEAHVGDGSITAARLRGAQAALLRRRVPGPVPQPRSATRATTSRTPRVLVPPRPAVAARPASSSASGAPPAPAPCAAAVQTYIPYIKRRRHRARRLRALPARRRAPPDPRLLRRRRRRRVDDRHPARRDHRRGRRQPRTTPATPAPPPGCASPPASSAPEPADDELPARPRRGQAVARRSSIPGGHLARASADVVLPAEERWERRQHRGNCSRASATLVSESTAGLARSNAPYCKLC